jgi:hypothetical protein
MSVANGGPDYDPDTWKLGYQQAQFGLGCDPPGDRPPSIYSALANPPANMTAAIDLPNPTVPNITPTQ